MDALVAHIEATDQEGRGIAHRDGKVVFIDGALPGETVAYRTTRRRAQFDSGRLLEILAPSFMRVAPRCPHFGTCGGCVLQHADPSAQVAFKQRVLEDNLARIGKVRPEHILPAIHGPSWSYRHRARLSVRHVPKKGGVLVGFHEKASSFIADMHVCPILPPPLDRLIDPLRELVGSLSLSDRIPQVEIAVGDEARVLVLRILEPLTPADEIRLREFADRHGIQWWLQPKGPDSVFPFYPLEAPPLAYRLPEFALELSFGPTEFTQVNPAVNRVLVRRALDLLDPRPGERVADLFCGLGNFSLPIARRGAHVVGLEGSAALVTRAARNAAHNGLEGRTLFFTADLFRAEEAALARFGHFDKLLIDPPRDGAIEVVKGLDADAPRRIVYVSCNPATLARDAAVLTHAKGYRLRAAGVVNMFPHTGHVESIALFER